MKPTSIQGALWCSVCNGRGYYPYTGNGVFEWIVCPVCKGTKVNTYKGKEPVTKKMNNVCY